MTERKYYFCVKENKNQFKKHYISFDGNGNITYYTPNFYTLEEIDFILRFYSKEQIFTKMQQDNVLCSFDPNEDDNKVNLTIQYQENGKERSIEALSQDCISFNIENFFLNQLQDYNKKLIYNNLGGYLDNQRISEQMKSWIKNVRQFTNEQILQEYNKLDYLEKRMIKKIIYEVLNLIKGKNKQEDYSIKKIQTEKKKTA